MADNVSPDERRKIMASVHNKNTRPEVIVRKYLFAHGYRFRKNDSRYPGKPDIVLPRYHTMIFVHGCFWHRHPGCSKATMPTTNEEYWMNKFKRNIERDKLVQKQLSDLGWRVILVWECEISSKKKRDMRLEKLLDEINAYDREYNFCK